jgi:hypothetical protein
MWQAESMGRDCICDTDGDLTKCDGYMPDRCDSGGQRGTLGASVGALYNGSRNLRGREQGWRSVTYRDGDAA